MQVNNTAPPQTYDPSRDPAHRKPRDADPPGVKPPAATQPPATPAPDQPKTSAPPLRPSVALGGAARAAASNPPAADRSETGARPAGGSTASAGNSQAGLIRAAASNPPAADRSETQTGAKPVSGSTASAGSSRAPGQSSGSPAAPDVGPTQMYTVFGSNTVSAPNSTASMQQREQNVDAYTARVKSRIANIESGSEGERNVKFLNARPFMTPAGYFSGGVLAAGYDPNDQIKGTFTSYVGQGRPQSQTGSYDRNYNAWEVAAGALAHDRPEPGGTVNFQSLHLSEADQAKVKNLESLGTKLQDHWQQDVAQPMQDPFGTLAARSGKADAYGLRATLQSLQSDKGAFPKLSPDGQQAINRTLGNAGQVIIPNVYGYPLAGHAFIPYKPYDGNYENRPNQGVMVDLNKGAVSEIKGDQDFADWAKRNRDNLIQNFNDSDRQGGLDAHWPKAGDVLDKMIAGNNVSYPGYKNLVADQRIPARELFNYTRARGSDYQLKYGNLTAGDKDNGGIASQYQSMNQKNAAWEDQTKVFGSSQQNWKTAKGIWGNTFAYVPGVGNLGNLVFGAHDALHGMTEKDRIGGNVEATMSGLQLVHDLAPGIAESSVLGKTTPSLKGAAAAHESGWKFNPKANEFEFQSPQPAASMAGATPGGNQGVKLTADNVQKTLPNLTPEGQKNAAQFFRDNPNAQIPDLRNQHEIDNATKFFNGGGKLGLKGGGGGNEGASTSGQGGGANEGASTSGRGGGGNEGASTSGQGGGGNEGASTSGQGRPGRLSQEQRSKITDYMRRYPEKTDRDVGQQFNVSAATINTLRHSAGLQKTSGKGVNVAPALRNEITEYTRQHPEESLASIAGRFHVSKTVVDGVRRSLGPQQGTPAAARNLTPDRREGIRNYIRQHPGATNTALAEHFHVSKSTITRLRTTGGVPKASGSGVPLTHAQRTQIADYIGQHPGQTSPQIARHFGVNPVTVYRINKILDRLGPHAFSSDAAAGPSGVPTVAPLHAPSTSGHPPPYRVHAGPSGTRPVVGRGATEGGGASAPKQPRIDAPPMQQQPQPGTSASGASAGWDPHAPSTSGQQPPPASLPPHPADEPMIQWMLSHLSPEEFDRVMSLPDEEFDRQMERIERLVAPAQQPPGTSTAAPPMQQQPGPQPGTSASGASAGRDPHAPSTSSQQPPPASAPPQARNEPLIDWILDHFPPAEVDRIFDLLDGELQRELQRIQRLMRPAQPPS